MPADPPTADLLAAYEALAELPPLVAAVRAVQRRLKEVETRPADSRMTTEEIGRAYMNEDRAVRVLADAAMRLADSLAARGVDRAVPAPAAPPKACERCGGEVKWTEDKPSFPYCRRCGRYGDAVGGSNGDSR